MDEIKFWKIIGAGSTVARDDPEGSVEQVQAELTRLEPAEISAFQRILLDKLNLAYSWPLWGAAYLINGGCSDDGFEYFRLWLISCGREIFESALSEPDALAGFVAPEVSEYECESLLYVAHKLYEKRTGKKLEIGERGQSPEPSGDAWDFDDPEETSRWLPRLSAIIA